MPPPLAASRSVLALAVAIAIGALFAPVGAASQTRPSRPSDERSGLKPTLEPDEPPLPGESGRKDADRLAPPPTPETPDYALQPPLLVYDGASFGPENAMPTRLAGLETPNATAICLDDDGRPWACGLQARAALNRTIRGRTVLCTAVAEATTEVPATCSIDGQDLAALVVGQGFARLRGRPASIEQERARQEKAGLWRGDWTIRQP